jgi:hypothetical protein
MKRDDRDDSHTVFCQTCSEWGHPRGECARDSSHETASLPVMKLRRNGPMSGEDFGGTSWESKRKHGIAKLELQAHSKGTQSTFGRTKAVYYLVHEHQASEVLKEWVSLNSDVLRGRGLTTESVTRALSKQEFRSAWKDLCDKTDLEVFEESDHTDRGGSHYGTRECPYCGETIKSLPGHLPCSAQ